MSPTTLWWKSWRADDDVLLLGFEFWWILLLLLLWGCIGLEFVVFPLLKFEFCCIINICLGVNMGLWGPKKWGGGCGSIGGGCPPGGWWKSPFGGAGWGKGGLKNGPAGPTIGCGGPKPGGPGKPFIRAAAAAAKNGCWCLEKNNNRHVYFLSF